MIMTIRSPWSYILLKTLEAFFRISKNSAQRETYIFYSRKSKVSKVIAPACHTDRPMDKARSAWNRCRSKRLRVFPCAIFWWYQFWRMEEKANKYEAPNWYSYHTMAPSVDFERAPSSFVIFFNFDTTIPWTAPKCDFS